MSDLMNDIIAARVRLCKEHGPDAAYNDLPGQPGGRYIDDCEDLANAYLAEHPADDEMPVDVAWLELVGFNNYGTATHTSPKDRADGKTELCIEVHATGRKITSVCETHTEVCYYAGVPDVSTRGDVRRLARALKIDLKEANG